MRGAWIANGIVRGRPAAPRSTWQERLGKTTSALRSGDRRATDRGYPEARSRARRPAGFRGYLRLSGGPRPASVAFRRTPVFRSDRLAASFSGARPRVHALGPEAGASLAPEVAEDNPPGAALPRGAAVRHAERRRARLGRRGRRWRRRSLVFRASQPLSPRGCRTWPTRDAADFTVAHQLAFDVSPSTDGSSMSRGRLRWPTSPETACSDLVYERKDAMLPNWWDHVGPSGVLVHPGLGDGSFGAGDPDRHRGMSWPRRRQLRWGRRRRTSWSSTRTRLDLPGHPGVVAPAGRAASSRARPCSWTRGPLKSRPRPGGDEISDAVSGHSRLRHAAVFRTVTARRRFRARSRCRRGPPIVSAFRSGTSTATGTTTSSSSSMTSWHRLLFHFLPILRRLLGFRPGVRSRASQPRSSSSAD